MSESNLLAVEYASIGMWGGLTFVGVAYMLYRRRVVKRLDIPALSKTRMLWNANASLIICLCSAASIIWSLFTPVDLTPIYIERAIFGRLMWIVAGMTLIVLSLKLERSSTEQESHIHREQRREELRGAAKKGAES